MHEADDAAARCLSDTHVGHLAPTVEILANGKPIALGVIARDHCQPLETFARAGLAAEEVAKQKRRDEREAAGRAAENFEWTLTRHVFKGDTIASTTEEGFVTRPGPSKFR